MPSPEQLMLNDLHIGMRVSESSLRNIFDTYITLVDSRIENDDIIGTIAFIGNALTAEADAIIDTHDNICSIYNSRDESSGMVTCDDNVSSPLPIARDEMDENGFTPTEASELKRRRIDLESGRYVSHELIEV